MLTQIESHPSDRVAAISMSSGESVQLDCRFATIIYMPGLLLTAYTYQGGAIYYGLILHLQDELGLLFALSSRPFNQQLVPLDCRVEILLQFDGFGACPRSSE